MRRRIDAPRLDSRIDRCPIDDVLPAALAFALAGAMLLIVGRRRRATSMADAATTLASSAASARFRRAAYWFENAASSEAVGLGNSVERMNPTASAAPCTRSIPAPSHSTEIGSV
ncbi:hypothetical protein GCM10022381_29690 [Leifsonia kafniensis]|uniref:PEP-CTERM sorting domain-containing protein n=1 Tax=Leifsonia kafniensis TaxID=475957 RepID=A0ABP7KRZ8_9MICO